MNSLFDKIQGLSEDGMFVLRNLLVFDPDKRMSATECLMHPYFEDIFYEEDLSVELKNLDQIFDALLMNKEQIVWRIRELAKECSVMNYENI